MKRSLASSPSSSRSRPPNAGAQASKPTLSSSTSAAQKPADAKADLLDLNTATREQLEAFPAIVTTYPQKIIDGRLYRVVTVASCAAWDSLQALSTGQRQTPAVSLASHFLVSVPVSSLPLRS